MPPTLVRPQTFDPLQSPDSASPAVRKGIRTKYLFSLRPSGLCKSIALSAYLSLPTFLRRRGNRELRLLGCLSPLSEWVNDQKHNTTFQLHKHNWRREFLSACHLGKPQMFIRHVSSLKARVSFAKKR